MVRSGDCYASLLFGFNGIHIHHHGKQGSRGVFKCLRLCLAEPADTDVRFVFKGFVLFQ